MITVGFVLDNGNNTKTDVEILEMKAVLGKLIN